MTQNYCPNPANPSNCSGTGILPDQNLATQYVYDLAGNRIESINPRGIITYSVFDALNRPTVLTGSCQTVPIAPATSCGTQTSDQNVTTTRTYDQVGHVLTTTDPLGRVNVSTYDALSRKVSETDNCIGTLCSGGVTSGQNLTTVWQADAQGDVLQVRSPRQCTTAAPCYQGSGGTTLNDDVYLATGYTYDGLFRLASVIEDQAAAPHLNLTTTYGYDPAGNKLTQVDGRGFMTTYTVDNLGRVIVLSDASGYTVKTYYSLAGEVTGTFNARQYVNANSSCTQAYETVCYTLDRVSRMTAVSYMKADHATQLAQGFAYDADGNMIAFSDSDVAQTTVTYDHLNRPSIVTAPSGTTSYTYFQDGATQTIVDPTGTTTFTEDRLGQVATMVSPLITGTTTYTFDAAGRLTARTEANGIVTTVGYTGANQVASKTETTSPANGNVALASWTAVNYDLAQNRTSETLTYYAANPYPDSHSGSPATYQYDSLNQLSQSSIPGATAATYGFDLAHNLTSNAGTAQTYNNNESLQTYGAATVGSDADGNQLSDVLGNALSWNMLSQLEKFSTTETYQYDALGRLTAVSNGAGAVTTKFVYQGLSGQVVEELDGAGAVVRSYAWDTTGRQLYTKIGASTYYEITDLHSDVVALATASALVGTVHFDSWGNAFTPSGMTVPFGYQGAAGSWTDGTTGFVNMGMRWYYPKVGRFLSSDPAAGSANPRTPVEGQRWLYVANNPLGNIDPSGLGCAWYDLGCHVEATISNAFNAASSAAIAVYNAATWAINVFDSALIWGLKTVLGTNGGGHKNDLLSRIQGAIRNKVIGAAYAGSVIVAQARPVAVNITKTTADSVASAVNSCQNAKKSVGNALGCVVSGLSVASLIVVPEGGLVADVAIQGLEHTAPELADLAAQGVEHLAPGAEQGAKDLAGEACSLIHSFAAGTLVMMADGSTKAIEMVKVGDSVEAEDPITGRLKAERVDATWDNTNPEGWVEIRAGQDDLNVTAEHPFWVASRGWVSAGALRPGDRLLSESGVEVVVSQARHFAVLGHHYNLTVQELHTFFVGHAELLVHNCGESAAAAFGRKIHAAFRAGLDELHNIDPRFQSTVMEGLLRPDGLFNRVAIELKPATLSGIRAGMRQLRRYEGGYLFTYDADGVISFLAQVAKP